VDIKKLKKIFEMVKENDITEFKIDDKNFELKIKRGTENNFNSNDLQALLSQSINNLPKDNVVNTRVINQKNIEKKNEDNLDLEKFHQILSPINGTFYSAPSPNDKDFIKVGDVVSAKQTICIVEAMKIMNEIKSDITGKVVKILVKNEENIKKNQPLVLIEKN
jgi:acetyl-CoA carboxylase biotin carboxyl carrier protein